MSNEVDKFINSDGLDSEREKDIGQHIGYRYDVNLVPEMDRCTDFLKRYMELMGWSDLNWLEDVHMGYEEGNAAVFDRNINGWVTIPEEVEGYFIEFLPFVRRCRFPDCSHTHETACGVKEAVSLGLIGLLRYESYCRIVTGDSE